MRDTFSFATFFGMGVALSGCFSFGMSVGVTDPAQDPPPAPPAPEQTALPPVDQAPADEHAVCEVGELAQCTGRCQEGDGASCNNLGAMYEMGSGVEMDLGRALQNYDLACQSGADGGCQNAARLRRTPPAADPSGGASPSWGI